MQDFEPISVGRKCFNVRVITTGNKNSYASVRNGEVVIRIPQRLGRKKIEEAAQAMYLRMKRGLERHPDRFIGNGLEFRDGQEISLLGESFKVHIQEDGRRSGAGRLRGSDMFVSLPWSQSENSRAKWTSSIVRRLAYPALRSRLLAYVDEINAKHFGSQVRDVRLHGGASRWGFCRPDGVISLSFELLFMPEECLEYVVVHELAHTKVRNHGRRFWSTVETAMPDYKKRRARLREGLRQEGSGT